MNSNNNHNFYNSTGFKPEVSTALKEYLPAELLDDSVYLVSTVLDMNEIIPILGDIREAQKNILDMDNLQCHDYRKGIFLGILSDNALNQHTNGVYNLKRLITNLFIINTKIEKNVPRH